MSVQMNKVGKLLKFDCCFAVSRKGKSGGLALMWNLEINVNMTSFSSRYVDAEAQTGGFKVYGTLTHRKGKSDRLEP